jgi:hypothetical protein
MTIVSKENTRRPGNSVAETNLSHHLKAMKKTAQILQIQTNLQGKGVLNLMNPNRKRLTRQNHEDESIKKN